MPVFGTIASQFNDPGTNNLYLQVLDKLNALTDHNLESSMESTRELSEKQHIIPPRRVRYLSEIAETNRNYDRECRTQSELAQELYAIYMTLLSFRNGVVELDSQGVSLSTDASDKSDNKNQEVSEALIERFKILKKDLNPHNWDLILKFSALKESYSQELFQFEVRGKTIEIPTHSKSLSHLQIPKIALPKYRAWGDLLSWMFRRMCPVPSHTPQASTPSNARARTPRACLPGKEAPKEPIEGFTMSA